MCRGSSPTTGTNLNAAIPGIFERLEGELPVKLPVNWALKSFQAINKKTASGQQSTGKLTVNLRTDSHYLQKER